VFPARDASIVMRAAVWPGEVVPDAAAQACSSRRGPLGTSSYANTTSWLGVPYAIEGTFIRTASSQVVQMEIVATQARTAFARELLAVWLKKMTE